MKHAVLLGLGSNIGDRIEFIATAIRAIADLEYTVVDDISGVYHTEPVGEVVQDYFLNVCISAKTDLDAFDFHSQIKKIETEIGRQQSVHWGPREIDIDILFFDSAVMQTENLTIPHREIVNRRFVLQPLSEIAPMAMHPVEKRSVDQLLAECTDSHAIEFAGKYTTQLLALINDSIANPTV
ncbi:MAG: 2-amino-4-hydroxy-6-hydroxymethyldihydropteridine diphosphokinase [Bacteroidota bacterium]